MQATVEATIGVGPRRIIERPRLTRLLDDTSARTIMLIAPAGYGKTTLARQWLENRPHAWCQGGVASSDVAALALGIAEAAGTLLPHVGRRLREWLPTSRGPENEVGVIERFLSEDLAEWPDETWFVIDDYQFLSSAASEDLVRRLFGSGQRRLLLTSRERPRWASARDLLYGNIFELSQSALAMNVDEANEVLASTKAEAASGLVALADGWPAVIGLAALMPHAITVDEGLPDELHDYLAEELFASLPQSVREDLCRLALMPTANRAAAEAMLGPAADEAVFLARDTGMFNSSRDHDPMFHPLLRRFLTAKARELDHEQLSHAVSRAVNFMIGNSLWDEAFSLISTFRRPDLLDQLLSEGIISMTEEGRLATLREWLTFARQEKHQTPYRDFAEAELAFRAGRHERAGSLAERAAFTFASEDRLRSLAHYRAGQSRHLVDDSAGALGHFTAAHETAQRTPDAFNAVWGQYVIAHELERVDTPLLFERLRSLGLSQPDAEARILVARFMLVFLDGPAVPARHELAAAWEIAEEVGDPLIGSGLWRTLAAAHVLTSDYELGLEAVRRGLDHALRFELDFARAHTLLSSVAANIALRRYSQADAELQEVEKAAAATRDPHVLANIDIQRCRLMLTEGSWEAALEAVSGTWSRGPTAWREMEFLTTKAAAVACNGNPRHALNLLDEAETLSRSLEPRILWRWIRAVCLLMLDDQAARSEIFEAFDATLSTRTFDIFVFAQRLHPGVIDSLKVDHQRSEAVASVLANCGEWNQAAAPNTRSRRSTVDRLPLTRREHQVYLLVAEGKSNREIARALFIEESTAKVHVRKILRKLDLRTRTEIAVHAARTQQPPAREAAY